jgi:perosamine synthetase
MMDLVPRDHWEHNLGDFFRGFSAALRPREQSKVLYIAKLGSCIPVRSGRAGLVAAIKALNLPKGARIGVPLYCCPVVFKAITTAGCKARFIDIDPETFCISPHDLSVKRSQVDAVVAVHMFGNLCDMANLLTATQDKPIIEDCAQALGSKIEGRMAGSFGTIAFFSFRSGKYLSAGEGGALFTSDSDLCSRVSQFDAEMPVPSYAEEFAHISKNYIKSMLRSRPLYGVAGHPLWNISNKRMNLSEKSHVALGQIYMTDFTIIRKRLPSLDSAIKRQRANAEFYSCTLKLEPGMLCLEKPGTFYNRYHYPITFPSPEHRDFIAEYLFNRQIDTMKYLDDIVHVATKFYGYESDCPAAERLSKRVLIIPSYNSLTKRDLRRIAECVNEGWAAITGRRIKTNV